MKITLYDWCMAQERTDLIEDAAFAAESVSFGSSKTKFPWRCHLCGYCWEATISNRRRPASKCPDCRGTGVSRQSLHDWAIANDREYLIFEALFDTRSVSFGNTDGSLLWR